MRWMVVVLCVATMAGCADDVEPQTDSPDLDKDALPSQDGRDLRTDLSINDTLQAPSWEVGDWFGHHIYFGPDDPTGTHIDVIVREAQDGYDLVTDDAEIARFEAVLDVPIVGSLAKDLDTTAFGGDWQVYDFPMRHGATWTGTITIDVDRSYDVTYEASFRDDFQTPSGKRPGFEIVGMTDGERIVKTDYVPDIGWYSEFITYNLDTPAEDDEYFRALSMGTGSDWTGQYQTYEADLLIDHFGYMAPADPASTPAGHDSFDVTGDHTHLMWLQFCFAAQGYSDVRLIDPDNESHECQFTNVDTGADPEAWGGGGSGDFYDLEDPTAGTWQVARANVGFVGGGGVEVWGLQEAVGQM